jgi:CBS domain containing-hemolysin-like protein
MKGYSRIPVYYGDNSMFVLGILIVKTLIGADIKNPKSLRELCKLQLCKIKTPSYVHPYAPMG